MISVKVREGAEEWLKFSSSTHHQLIFVAFSTYKEKKEDEPDTELKQTRYKFEGECEIIFQTTCTLDMSWFVS